MPDFNVLNSNFVCDNDGGSHEVVERIWECKDILFESDVNVSVDLTDAEFPVMGNTEDVPNGQSGFNGLSKAQRVNNYMSWYLQGVDHTAEEEFEIINPFTPNSGVDYAGPVQKLFPHVTLEAMRTGQGNFRSTICKIIVKNPGSIFQEITELCGKGTIPLERASYNVSWWRKMRW